MRPRLAVAGLALLAFGGTAFGGSAAGAAAPRSVGPATVRADVAALVLSGQNGGALPMALAAVPLADDAVAAVVEVAGDALLAAGPRAAGPRVRVELFLYLLGADGQTLAHHSERLDLDTGEHRPALAAAGLRFVRRLAAPAGEHRLRALVRLGEPGDRVFGVVGVPVVLPDVGDPPGEDPPGEASVASWLDVVPATGNEAPAPPSGLAGWPPAGLERLAEEAAPDVALPELAPDALPIEAEAIRGELRRVVARLAAGERTAALEALVALEVRATVGLTTDVGPLAKVETRYLGDLVSGRWPAFLPLADLYLEAHGVYRRRGQHLLAVHAEQMTIDLAVVYARRQGSAEAKGDAARLVAALGLSRLESGAFARAEQHLLLAQELDPTHTGAPLLLAALREKLGRLADAVTALESLRAVAPEHREGRLRLAVALRRRGEASAAEELLAGLHAGDDWIAVVAYEESARLAADAGRWDAAATVLERGLERFPEHPRLLIPLAYARERQGRGRAEVRSLLVAADRARPEIGERSRYNRWPDGEVVAERAAVAQRATGLGAQLAAALQSAPAESGPAESGPAESAPAENAS